MLSSTFLSSVAHVHYGYDVEPRSQRTPQFRQVHGARILGPTERSETALADADGAWTAAFDEEMFAFSADCVPLLYFGTEAEDPVTAVHSGWRGTCAGIPEEGLRLYRERNALERTHVAIGPCIRACCFAVREDFVAAFRAAGHPVDAFLERHGNLWHFALDRFVLDHALAAIPEARQHRELLRCTVCSDPQLPSYRRDGSTDPRIRSWIRKTAPRVA